MKFSFLIAICSVWGEENAAEDEGKEREDDIEHVDDINELRTMINSNKYLLAYFFHPNCHPCMEYIGEFDRLPEEMDELDWASEVEFVKINMAGNEKTIPELYGVRGYPWIEFYKNGKGIRYKGRRKNKKLIRFVYRRMEQSFRHIDNIHSAIAIGENYNEDSSVLCLSYFPEGSEKFEIVSNVTDDYDHITFAWTSDKDVAAQFGIKQHGVFTVKYALPDRLNKHEGKVSHESLIFFLDHYGNPLVMEYGEETTMIIFEKEYKMQVHLLLPDPKDEKEREKINKILKEFMDAAGKTERAGYGKDTVFIVTECDNPDNFRLVTFLDVLDGEPPTYRIMDTASHNRYGRQMMSKKEWKSDRIVEVLESARSGEEKFMLSEGAPEDFYSSEILFLTTAVLEQNIQVGKPLLILFHNGENEEEMQILEELTNDFPHATYKKKKRGYPRLAKYNIKRNIILDNPWSQVLRGMNPKAGDFFLIRNLEKMVKYTGSRKLDAMRKWIQEKSEIKHDEL